MAMQKGIARGIFSNEAGIGSAPIAAAAAQNDSPAKQGLISMMGTIIDTLIICTMTGLTIVITDSWNVGLDGVDVTTRAFQQGLPFNSSIASFILMVCLVFFAFTTILGWDYYSERCLEYLIGQKPKAIKVYRWIYSQLEKQPEKVKDELITFLGTSPMFKAFEADLPVQMGQTIELRDYQQEAIDNLKKMREDGKTIALLYHATGVGKTITAATDAKAVGGRTLFLVNALKLASQAKETFAKVWSEATLGEYTGSQKDMTQTVIFATVQSISKDLENSPRQILII